MILDELADDGRSRMLDWRTATLRELIDEGAADLQTGPFGTMLHASAYSMTGTPVVAVQHIGDNRLKHENLPKVDDETAVRLAKYKLLAGDILFGRKGAVDRRALVRQDEEGWLQGSDCIRLRLNEAQISPLFVSFLLGTRSYRSWVVRQAQGATMPSLNQEILGRVPLRLPSLNEQLAIGDILGALDDKIDLNRRMNRTLEQLAAALFKSWFIDFDPVHSKMEGRQPFGMNTETAALFPERLIETAIGQIPAGWPVKSFEEVMDINPRRELQAGELAPYLEMAGLPTAGARVLRLAHKPFASGSRFRDGDVLLARITPCLENGKTAFVDCLDGRVGWGSTEFIVLHALPPLPLQFAYFLARDEAFRMISINSMTGSSGRQRVQLESIRGFPLAVPPANIASRFGMLVAPMFESLKLRDEESMTLATLRDTLLPKLLSGQIRVGDAERELAAVM